MTAQLLYDNRLADAAVSATTTDTGFDADNISDWRTNTRWQSSSTATQYLTVDCGSAKSADTVGLAVHNLATAGASLAVECSSDNFVSDTTVAKASASVVDDGVLYLQFASQSKQYWRLKITGLTVKCYIALAVIGERVEFPELIEGEFSPGKEQVQPGATVAAKGQTLEVVKEYTTLSSRVGFQLITDAWFRDTFMPVWDAHLRTLMPFFWVPNYDLDATGAYVYRIAPGGMLDAHTQAIGKRRFSLSLVGVVL